MREQLDLLCVPNITPIAGIVVRVLSTVRLLPVIGLLVRDCASISSLIAWSRRRADSLKQRSVSSLVAQTGGSSSGEIE
jgi:hypothetical protein